MIREPIKSEHLARPVLSKKGSVDDSPCFADEMPSFAVRVSIPYFGGSTKPKLSEEEEAEFLSEMSS